VGVSDIAREAGVAHGTFYTYFESKRDVFRLVAEEVFATVDEAVQSAYDEGADPVDAITRANNRYVEIFRGNARIYAVYEQLAHVDPELGKEANTRRRLVTDRLAHLILRWQTLGLADPTVDPLATASVLISMISNTCYWLFVGGDEEPNLDGVVNAINQVWIRATDLRGRPNRRWLAR
jgi:AcrR family transcriptional regulator